MYQNKKVAITGATGFLGSSLSNELRTQGARVVPLIGDVRDSKTFGPVDYSYDYVFHFGAPSSQILFKRQPDYAFDVTINGFRNAAQACQRTGAKLIYPSTGLLSFDKPNEYARGKQVCEDLAAKADCDILGLRIFGTYGPGEEMKRDFASVPYLFLKDIMENRQPVIYGKGEQIRDFIYIEDTVKAILAVADRVSGGTVDIGSGEGTIFNDIPFVIGQLLGRQVEVTYVDKPEQYIDSTVAEISQLEQYYKPQHNFKQGMEKLVAYEKNRRGL